MSDSDKREALTVIQRSSGWEDLFRLFGWLGLVAAGAGLMFFLSSLTSKSPPVFLWPIWLIVAGIIGSIHAFCVAFIISVLTDIRWSLSKDIDKENHDA
jgi:hypothetical protein